MPSTDPRSDATDRRSVLATLGSVAVAGLAGCSTGRSGEPPAGSLRFENDHDLPHSITLRVVDVGAEPARGTEDGQVEGDALIPPHQRNLTASTTVEPGGARTYESVFTESVWYAVAFTMDGREPEHGEIAYNPAPANRGAGRVLEGQVSRTGEFLWGIASTDDAGSFELGTPGG